jgi:hypothetical protein
MSYFGESRPYDTGVGELPSEPQARYVLRAMPGLVQAKPGHDGQVPQLAALNIAHRTRVPLPE